MDNAQHYAEEPTISQFADVMTTVLGSFHLPKRPSKHQPIASEAAQHGQSHDTREKREQDKKHSRTSPNASHDEAQRSFEASGGVVQMKVRDNYFTRAILEPSQYDRSSKVQKDFTPTVPKPGPTRQTTRSKICSGCSSRLCGGGFEPRSGRIRAGSHVLQRSYLTTNATAKSNADNGCVVCHVIASSIDEAKMLATQRKSIGAERVPWLMLEEGDFSVDEPINVRLHLKGNGYIFESLQVEVCAQNGARVLCPEFVVLASPESLTPRYVGCRGIFKDTTDPRSTKLIKSWLEQCIRSHPQCHPANNGRLPSRLLDLAHCRTLQKVFFRRNDAPAANYVALSYCWGGPQSFLLTEETYHRFRTSGISLKRLPKTIQDAIHVSIAFGVRYVWIDALCIIQDSAKDKSEQLRQMRTIFQNAYFTISAASAASVNSGFLGRRSGVQLREYELPLRPRPEDKVEVVKFLDTREIPALSRGRNPVESRGWTLPEKLLSSRIISYTATHLEWQCACTTLRPERRDQPRFQGTLECSLQDNDEDWRALHQFWADITIEYSTRSFSEPPDVLPALAGVAAEFQIAFKSAYLAGIWATSIPNGLTWYRKGGTDIDLSISAETFEYRPIIYMAPSWSWASISEPIDYCCGPEDRLHTTAWPFLELLDWDIQIADAHLPLGAVVSGALTLRGPVKNAWLHRGRVLSAVANWLTSADTLCVVHPDCREVVETPNMAVTCLRIADTSGLVLRSTGERQDRSDEEAPVYERVGLFSMTRTEQIEWFCDWDDATVVLI